jgi:hypothetical protein
MKRLLPFCLTLLFSACGEKSPAPPSAGVSSGKPAAATESAIDGAATLNRLTQAVRKYSAENRRVPKSLDELVSAGYLPDLPAAPGGKKYVIDDQLRVTVQ